MYIILSWFRYGGFRGVMPLPPEEGFLATPCPRTGQRKKEQHILIVTKGN